MCKAGLLIPVIVGLFGCQSTPQPPPTVAPAQPQAEPKNTAPQPISEAPPISEATPTPAPIPTRTEPLDEMLIDVPESWVRHEPKNALRKAQFVLPGEIEFVVFRFPGGAGGTQANLERWRSQFREADDSTTTTTVGSLTITIIDLTGFNVVGPPSTAASDHDQEPKSRLVGAVVEGSGDPWFFKCVGPATTMDPEAEQIKAAVESIRPSP